MASFIETLMQPDPELEQQRQFALRRQFLEKERLDTERERFMSDPALQEKVLAHFAHGSLPEKKAAKIPYGSTLAKIEGGIPSDDPRKMLASSIMQVAPNLIAANPDKHPAEVLAGAYVGKERDLVENKGLYNFIREKNSSFFGSGVAEAPGYREWKAAQKTPEWEWTNPLESFGIGTGFSLAGAALGLLIGKSPMAARVGGALGGRLAAAVAGKTGGEIVKKAAVAGIAAIPSFAAFDIPANIIRQSDWAQDRPLASLGAELILGGGAAGIADRAALKATAAFKNTMKSMEGLGVEVAKDPSVANLMRYSDLTLNYKKTAADYVAKSEEALQKQNGLTYTDQLVSKIAKPNWNDEIHARYVEELASGKTPAMALNDARSTVAARQETEGAARKLALDEVTKKAEEEEFQSLFKSRMLTEEGQRLGPIAVTEQIKRDQLLSRAVTDFETYGGSTKDFSVPGIDSRLTKAVDKTALREELSANIKRHDDFLSNFINKFMAPRGTTLAGQPMKLASGSTMQNKELVSTLKEAHQLHDTGIMDDATFGAVSRSLESEINARGLSRTGQFEAVVQQQRRSLEKMKASGQLTEEKYNKAIGTLDEFEKQRLPKLKEAAVSIFDTTPKTNSKWFESADTVLEGALNHPDSNAGQQLWDRTVLHFAESNPSVTERKAFNALLEGKANTERFTKMFQDSRESFISSVSDIVYGNAEKTKAAFAADVKSGMTKGQILEKYGKLGIYAGVGTVAAGLGLSLLSPNEADAASIRFDPRVLRALKNANPSMTEKQLSEKIADSGIHTPVISQEGDVVVSPMKSLNFVPSFDDVARKQTLGRFFDAAMTLPARGQFYFKQWSNPMVVIASKMRAAEENSYAYSKVAANILKGFEDSSKPVREAMKPLIDKYGTQALQHGALRRQLSIIDDTLAGKLGRSEREDFTNLSKRIKNGTVDEDDIALLTDLKADREKITARIAELDPMMQSREAEWTATVKQLAQQYPSVRMFLASTGKYGMQAEDPWLLSMLTSQEKTAYGKIRLMLDDFGNRMVESGEKKLTREDFIHYASHPDIDFKSERKALEGVMSDTTTGIDLAHFHHRGFDTLPMMPDIRYSLSRYIPDANRRIEMADFWREWAPFMKKVGDAGMRGPFELLQDVAKGFSPVDRFGSWEKWADRIQMFEVARLLSLSPSVAFKHGLKITADIAFYGFKNAMVNLPKAVPLWKDMYVTNLLDRTPPNMRADLARAFIGGRNLIATISDLVPNEMNQTHWDKLISKWNKNTNFLVQNVELFDRGYSFTSAIAMASKKGMTPEQASYLVYDTIIKANFLSGVQNPTWLKDPKTRLLFLFQGTPFKIFEQRVITAIRGGQAVSNATQEFIRQIKADVKEGQKRFNAGLIMDALNAPRDLNGMSYAGQLARMILTTGGIIAYGKYNDVELFNHMMHVPLTPTTETGTAIATNPLMSAAIGTWKGRDTSEENVAVDFLNKWLPNKGIPASIVKMARLSKNDIPEIYRDSKFQYFFGIPSTKESLK